MRKDKNTGTARPTRRWRVVDIITAAVLGVATGLIFWVWNGLGGVLGGLIIRKPGAAIMV